MKTHSHPTRRYHSVTAGRRLLLAGATVAWLMVPCAGRSDSIVDSLHNLSATGPGTIRAASESRICVFCHTPHGASVEAPLWNRYSSGALYTPYNSSTAKAIIGQPTGASKLCLSCHDGTVALGMVRSETADIAFGGGVFNMPPGRSNLGNDLSDDHPISFLYDDALAAANGELESPGTLLGPVRLDSQQRMQCTSCHDPHDNAYGDFLVMNNASSALCATCHDKDYWIDSTHRTSTKTWNGQGLDPWPNTDETTVAGNACQSCHTPHAAGTSERLLAFAGEEQNCYRCHNGNVAATDIDSEFDKSSVHPVALTAGVHDPTEDPINPTRHVECMDCHNSHAVTAAAATAPDASGALAGLTGVELSGSVITPLAKAYELCFRCHADSTDRGDSLIARQFPQTNTRLEFDPANASYHPVAQIGKNADVPSLINPYTESSIIYCTDCHNNDQGPGAGGSGPDGPHGSAYEPILERRLELANGTAESPSVYAMCFKCHDYNSIMGDEGFKAHDKHVKGENTACTTCHDPHGVAGVTHLINFNLLYVQPSSNGRLEFIDEGYRRGNCSLTCHGKDHDALHYEP